MAITLRFQYQTGASLAYSIERHTTDGHYYDFSNGTFAASPTTPVQTLAENRSLFTGGGSYEGRLTPSPTNLFGTLTYCVRIHNTAANNQVVAMIQAQDDSAGAVLDPTGVDPVILEANPGGGNVNLRQGLAEVFDAVVAGNFSGVGTTQETLKDPTNQFTRAVANVDNNGNRTLQSLTPPA